MAAGTSLPERPDPGDEFPRLTLPGILRRGLERWGDQELLVHDGAGRSWRDVERQSAELAKGLIALGVGKGSRVGLLMHNSADWILAFLAASRIGALVSPLSTFLQGPELSHALHHADIQVLLTADRFLAHDYVERLEQLPGLQTQSGPELFLPRHPYLRRIVLWGGSSRSWALDGPADLLRLAAETPALDDDFLLAIESSVEPADLLLTIWTSGSTSEPKGVVHSHGGVIRYCHGFRKLGRGDLRLGERSYATMPFFWLGGLNVQIIPALLAGAVVVTTDQIEPSAVLDRLIEDGVARVTGWLGPLAALQHAARERGIDVSHIRGLAFPRWPDGSPVPEEQRSNAFGMTETFGPHSAEANGAILPVEKAGAMGRVVAGYERQIVDPADDRPLATGEIGELRVRGPSLMQGYYKREREETYDADGFFRTGDRCSLDADGFLFFHGRGTDLIKTSGANVSPREIEQLLESFEEVAEAVVFGVPDQAREEAIVAVVVPAAGCSLTSECLRERMRSEISHYKVPHQIVSIEQASIPRTDTGKPRKSLLRESLLESGAIESS